MTTIVDALAVVQVGVCLAAMAWVAFATLRLDERCRAQEERAAVAEVEAQRTEVIKPRIRRCPTHTITEDQ